MEDFEIAQKAGLIPIEDVAKKVDLKPEDLKLYGKFKAKVLDSAYEKFKHKNAAKLVLVTSIHPTPLGKEKQQLA